MKTGDPSRLQRDWRSNLFVDDVNQTKRLVRHLIGKQTAHDDESLYLAELAEIGGFIANLGCYSGSSASALAWGLNHFEKVGHVYTVDIYDTRPDLKHGTTGDFERAAKNIADRGLSNRITQCVGTTLEWAEKLFMEFSVVFIDADHSYEACKADFEAWAPKVRYGGLIAFHDAHSDEVHQVVEEALSSRCYVEVPGCYSIRTLRKRR